MLDRLQHIARRWRGLKSPALIAALGLFVASAAVVILMPGPRGDQVLLPIILGCVWAISGYLFIYLFEAVPPPPDPDSGLITRLQRRLTRGLYWLLALAFVVLGALVLMLSVRLIREWLGGLPG
jgi:hypothetical protein